MGDFNSRVGKVGKFNDFIEISIYLVKIVQDISTNNMGYKLIEFCANNHLHIVNNRVGNDIGVGAFTCKSRSTVDYVHILSSRELLNISIEIIFQK